DPRRGDPHVEIVLERALDQIVEHRVAELLPPGRLERLADEEVGVRLRERRGRGRRRRVIGADRAARDREEGGESESVRCCATSFAPAAETVPGVGSVTN